MQVLRLFYTPMGRVLLSMILGIGLATLFRKVCTDKNCIVFNGPVISEFENKIFKHGEKCYKYTAVPDTCDPLKRIIDVSDPIEPEKPMF